MRSNKLSLSKLYLVWETLFLLRGFVWIANAKGPISDNGSTEFLRYLKNLNN